MMKPTCLLITFILLSLFTQVDAQTWKPLGLDENNNPSVSYISTASMATAPDGTVYIAEQETAYGNQIIIKKYDGTKWVQTGNPVPLEGYADNVNFVIAPDGIFYISYEWNVLGTQLTANTVRRLIGDTWVRMGTLGAMGVSPNLVIAADGTPYLFTDGNYAFYSPAVSKFVNGAWQQVGSGIANKPISNNQMLFTPDGSIYVAYIDGGAINVLQYVSGAWKAITSPNAKATNLAFAADAAGVIYLAYDDSGNAGKAAVQRYQNGNWAHIGTAALSTGKANSIRMTFLPNQSPYLIFTDAGNGNKVTVKNYVNNDWSNMGQGVISQGSDTYPFIMTDKNGNAWANFVDYNLGLKLHVKELINNAWTDVGMNAISGAQSAAVKLVVSKDISYVAFNDPNYQGKISVKKYQSGSWQYVGAPGFTVANNKDMGFCAAPDGTLYLIYQDYGGTNNDFVMKYNGTAWVAVGPMVGVQGAYNPDITIAPDGTPYVTFNDSKAGRVVVQKYSNGSWVNVGNNNLSVAYASNMTLKFNSKGVLYIAMNQGGGNILASVMVLNNDVWTLVGNNVTTGIANSLALAIAPDDTPYVAYTDVANASKVTVQKFTANAWQQVGTASVVGSLPKLAFNSSGNPYLAYLSNRPFVKTLSAGQWVDAGSVLVSPYQATSNDFGILSDGTLIYAYLDPDVFVRTLTSDDLPQAPTITSCTPDVGPSGTVVTISGFNLGKTSAIMVGTTPAASFTIVSATSVTAVVASGSTGDITVTTPYGKAAYHAFTYVSAAPPVITSLSSNTANAGKVITINGKNFGTSPADNTVYFGAVKALVTSASATALQVQVPVNATYQPVSVTANQLTGYSSSYFDLSFLGKTVLDANSFSPKFDFAAGQIPFNLLPYDFDGDGNIDVITGNGNSSGTINILRNTSDKTNITFASTNITWTQGNSLAATDLNGDGKLDMIYPAYGIGFVQSLFNNSTTGQINFNTGPTYRINPQGYSIATGDLDGDGRPDVVTVNNFASTFSVLRNTGTINGSTYFDDVIELPQPNNAINISIADLDGDNRPELIIADNSTSGKGTITIYQNNSTPQKIAFTKVATLATDVDGQKPIIADFDYDGKMDIAIPNKGANNVMIYKNQSSGSSISFATGMAITTGNKPTGLCSADFNGDSKPDLAVTNSGDNTISVFLNSSTPAGISFAAKKDYTVPAGTADISAADIDGDGAPDLIITNHSTNIVSVLKNNTMIKLAVTDLKLSTTSITCKGQNNGMITISPVQTLDYTAIITGPGNYAKTQTFNSNVTVDGLVAGTYHVCITVAGLADFNQCADLVITEPKDLSVYATVDKSVNTVSLNLSGGNSYTVLLNGATYTTSSNAISLPLNKGSNKLTVSTDKPCQGAIEQLIDLSGITAPYPSPFQDQLYVNLGEATSAVAVIKIFNVNDGSQVLSRQYNNASGVVQLNVSALKTGIYTLRLQLDQQMSVFKIVKQ